MDKLSDNQIEEKLENFPGWEYSDGMLRTTFEFDDFKDAFSVMTRIAFEAEVMQHHPDWHNVYNTLHIALMTHDVDGISEKDFKMVQAIEYIVGEE